MKIGPADPVGETPREVPTEGYSKVEKVSGKEIVSTREQAHTLGLVLVKGPHVLVTVELGQTVNMGNFNSIRATVGVQVPVALDDEAVEVGYARAVSWVQRKINALLQGSAPASASGSPKSPESNPFG